MAKQVVIDLTRVVSDAIHRVNDIVRDIMDQNPNFDFFDVFYRVHIAFIQSYLNAIMHAMNELGTVTQAVGEFAGGEDEAPGSCA